MTQVTIPTLWQRLVVPHPSIKDVETRRQSRLLASFILVLMGVFTFMAVWGIFSEHDMTGSPILLINVVILGGEYFLNRSGRYKPSAYLFVLLSFFFVHILSLSSIGALSRMYYIALAILVSALFLSLRSTVILVLLSMGIQIVAAAVAPSTSEVVNSSPLFFTFVIGPIVLIFLQHRTALESERQAELAAANSALRESEASLEKRVAERTRDLEIAADVSRQITTILNLKELLNAVVGRTKAGFNLYHVSIFLFNSASQCLTLEASTGDAGAAMQAESWSFSLQKDQGLVPETARTRRAVLINDVSQETHYRVNPHLPGTRSELALPMIVGDKLIGVLDVQSEMLNQFDQDDVRVLQSLAEQIAIAVDNARLYAEQIEVAEKLRGVDTIKSQFLASMSHELRTPLNAILNFTEFVALGMLGPVNDQQEDALNKALDSSRHLLDLINDVLDITKIEAEMMKLFVEDNINVLNEIAPVIATAQTLLKDKPVTFVQDIEENLPGIIGDRRRIRQILLNLISNAVKFTDEGKITLRVKRQLDSVLFSVCDTGPGIAPEDQTIIFQPFIQTESGIQHAGGTGLGLPISKRLAEAHGGSLWVESNPGEGATFSVLLPIRSKVLLELIEGEKAEQNA